MCLLCIRLCDFCNNTKLLRMDLNRKHLFVMNKRAQPVEWEIANFLELVTFGCVAGILAGVGPLS